MKYRRLVADGLLLKTTNSWFYMDFQPAMIFTEHGVSRSLASVLCLESLIKFRIGLLN